MSAPSITAATELAGAWVAAHFDELARAARAAGLAPHDLDGAAWLAVLPATKSGREPRENKIIAAAVYALVGRGHRGLRAPLDEVVDPGGGIDPLARLVAAAEITQLIDTSRWCRDAAREAAGAPLRHIPDPDPRGAKTRQRRRARERAGQLTFGGWGWQT